jgi:hypothetical protein
MNSRRRKKKDHGNLGKAQFCTYMMKSLRNFVTAAIAVFHVISPCLRYPNPVRQHHICGPIATTNLTTEIQFLFEAKANTYTESGRINNTWKK